MSGEVVAHVRAAVGFKKMHAEALEAFTLLL